MDDETKKRMSASAQNRHAKARVVSPAKRRTCISLRDKGLSLQEIADRTGLAMSTIWDDINQTKHAVEQLHSQGKDMRFISSELQISQVAVHNFIERLSTPQNVGSSMCTACSQIKPTSAFQADRRKPGGLTAHCKECRAREANRRKYRLACVECGWHRRLDANLVCSKCNLRAGLRQCRACRQMLPALVSYYNERAICKECLTQHRAQAKE